MGYTWKTTCEMIMESWNPVGRELLLGWVFLLEFFLLFLYFLLLRISPHCLAVHFVKACIKLSSIGGGRGGSRGERG